MMFCPTCGTEDRNRSQFCRGCGAELRAIRTVLQQPDGDVSYKSAREDVARAIAARIKELENDDDLRQIVEDVLPKVEKFLESPAERRLRRIRSGVVTALIGLAPLLIFVFFGAAIHDQDLAVIFTLLALATFLIGTALVVNGLFFSLPNKAIPGIRDTASGGSVDQAIGASSSTSRIDQQALPEPASIASVIEHTTKHLPVEVLNKPQPRNTRE